MTTHKTKQATKAKPGGGATEAPVAKASGGKLATLITMLRTPEGTTLEQMVTATGWQAHSVRGAMSGALKRKQGLTISSEKTDAGRIYRITQAG
jgi:uncharacterized protein YjhX (UPF0386 family)